MAAINVVLNGVFTTDAGATNGSFIGQMAYSDRGVGGGPVLPPSAAHPEHPIVLPKPPSDAHPEHPIYLPDPPTEIPPGPADDQGWLKPPPDGGWGYHNVYGWLYNPAEGVATPKS